MSRDFVRYAPKKIKMAEGDSKIASHDHLINRKFLIPKVDWSKMSMFQEKVISIQTNEKRIH